MRITVGVGSPVATLRGIFGTSEPTIPGSLKWLNATSDRILQKDGC
jgi:hypothetical protein